MAQGECQVGVNDHLYRLIMVRQIEQGEYFGEVALIFGIDRTATVVSSNYCTMATISSEVLLRLLHSYSEVFREMKKKALQYNDQDKWKEFKIMLLKEIDYFKSDDIESKDPVLFEREFYEEIQF